MHNQEKSQLLTIINGQRGRFVEAKIDYPINGEGAKTGQDNCILLNDPVSIMQKTGWTNFSSLLVWSVKRLHLWMWSLGGIQQQPFSCDKQPNEEPGDPSASCSWPVRSQSFAIYISELLEAGVFLNRFWKYQDSIIFPDIEMIKFPWTFFAPSPVKNLTSEEHWPCLPPKSADKDKKQA